MSAQEKQEIMEEMRRRYCYPANRSPPPPPRSPPPSRSGSPSKARPPDEPEWKKHAREDIRRLPPPDVKPGNW